jgi:hypothetical protein
LVYATKVIGDEQLSLASNQYLVSMKPNVKLDAEF